MNAVYFSCGRHVAYRTHPLLSHPDGWDELDWPAEDDAHMYEEHGGPRPHWWPISNPHRNTEGSDLA